jgi:hypothetical protein
MYSSDRHKRRRSKTSEQSFLLVLQREFHFAPKIAQAILEEAQEQLYSPEAPLRPGQIRIILARRDAKPGVPLKDTDKVQITWTIDAGLEDQLILQKSGRIALRHARLQRLTVEALDQDAVATIEDLAYALQVSPRTIKRDCAALADQDIYLPTRGALHQIGRGQTHKAQIVGLWLAGNTYDQIVLKTHHTSAAIKRYIQVFVRVIAFHHQEVPKGQIAQLLQIGKSLVEQYLDIYAENDNPECQERLAEQLDRLIYQASPLKKSTVRRRLS